MAYSKINVISRLHKILALMNCGSMTSSCHPIHIESSNPFHLVAGCSVFEGVLEWIGFLYGRTCSNQVLASGYKRALTHTTSSVWSVSDTALHTNNSLQDNTIHHLWWTPLKQSQIDHLYHGDIVWFNIIISPHNGIFSKQAFSDRMKGKCPVG